MTHAWLRMLCSTPNRFEESCLSFYPEYTKFIYETCSHQRLFGIKCVQWIIHLNIRNSWLKVKFAHSAVKCLKPRSLTRVLIERPLKYALLMHSMLRWHILLGNAVERNNYDFLQDKLLNRCVLSAFYWIIVYWQFLMIFIVLI